VAGISMWWRSSPRSVRDSVLSVLRLASEHDFRSIAFPLIGAGTGGGNEAEVQTLIEKYVQDSDFEGRVVIVRYDR
jgi:O-acetyl-ADP-ribose deacetylase (regulator of RNase III)